MHVEMEIGERTRRRRGKMRTSYCEQRRDVPVTRMDHVAVAVAYATLHQEPVTSGVAKLAVYVMTSVSLTAPPSASIVT
jgi:hypothetical protein